eukprot:3672435-Amphidinium_carterae.1
MLAGAQVNNGDWKPAQTHSDLCVTTGNKTLEESGVRMKTQMLVTVGFHTGCRKGEQETLSNLSACTQFQILCFWSMRCLLFPKNISWRCVRNMNVIKGLSKCRAIKTRKGKIDAEQLVKRLGNPSCFLQNDAIRFRFVGEAKRAKSEIYKKPYSSGWVDKHAAVRA